MKKLFAIGLIFTILLFFSCVSSGGGSGTSGSSGTGVIINGNWWTQDDVGEGGDSEINLTVADEVIDGQNVKTYTITGKVTTTHQNSFVNLILDPTDEEMEVLKQAKSFSFKCISDGKRYAFYFMSSDVKDWAFHGYNIDTEANVVETVEFPASYMFQPGWGKEVPLRTQNCTGVRFAPHESNRGQGDFKFKFWDFTVIMK